MLESITSLNDVHSVCVHAGRHDFREIGVHAPPIDFSSTYPFSDLGEASASLDQLVAGEPSAQNSIYSRLFNPTVDRVEKAIAELECGAASVAFASGMSAFTACLLAERHRGDHIVAIRPIYGTADHLLSSELLGMRVSWATGDTIADAIRPDTALIIIETPANPTLELLDIAAVAQEANNIPVLVDSTFATPVLQQPLSCGATYSLHSATKFLSGHGDVIAGVVTTDEESAARLRQVRLVTGSILHPMAAYLLHRSLPTLALRVERAQNNAREIADRLCQDPRVERVLYPGLEGCDPDQLVGRQMRGPGSILSFDVGQNIDGVHEFHADFSAMFRSLTMITPAVSLGSTDTLIQHPAGLTHRIVAETDREQAGITPGLLRLSVGIENVEDIWSDLQRGLSALQSFRLGSLTRQSSSSLDFASWTKSRTIS